MRTGYGNDIVKEFRERGTGALARVQKQERLSGAVVAAVPQVSVPARTSLIAPADTSEEQRQRRSDQRRLVAIARLLILRMGRMP